MEKKSKITYAMIETAIDKGIRDIKENSNRGIRSLLDLGIHFSTGSFQKEFFIIAKQMLDNDNSPYYELVNRIIQNTDPWILKHFGINVGYNCWTYGAEKIKKFESQNGYNVPWSIVFDFLQETEDILSEEEISNILNSGEHNGIYSGMFFVNIDKEYLNSLLKILELHKNSSYFIFLKPDMITDEIAKILIQAGNIVPVLAMDSQNNSICKSAADILMNSKCLYGVYSMCNDFNIEYIMNDTYLRQIEDLHSDFAFFISQSLSRAQNKERFSQFIKTARSAIKYPFFIFDFYEDYKAVSRMISAKEYFTAIKGNGSVEFSLEDTLDRCINIRTHSLKNILKTIPYI